MMDLGLNNNRMAIDRGIASFIEQSVLGIFDEYVRALISLQN